MGLSQGLSRNRCDECQGLNFLGKLLNLEVARVAGGERSRRAVGIWLPLTAVGNQVSVLIQGERL